MAYCTFATMFIAQAYGVDMPLSKQLAMAAVLMLTSKGVAGVRAPRWSSSWRRCPVRHPGAGLLLILGIDQFLDMGRSATNVIGNSLRRRRSPSFERSSAPPRTRCPAAVRGRCPPERVTGPEARGRPP